VKSKVIKHIAISYRGPVLIGKLFKCIKVKYDKKRNKYYRFTQYQISVVLPHRDRRFRDLLAEKYIIIPVKEDTEIREIGEE